MMPGEPQTEECADCGKLMMWDNAIRCLCGLTFCCACWDEHECKYTVDPEYDEVIHGE